MSDPEAELRAALTDVFDGPNHPVEAHIDRVRLLAKGPPTIFRGDGLSISVMELGMKYRNHLEFPYLSCEQLLDDIMGVLKADGTLSKQPETMIPRFVGKVRPNSAHSLVITAYCGDDRHSDVVRTV